MDDLLAWAANRIRADSASMAILTGLVWEQPIIPEPEDGSGGALTPEGWYYATPEAFDPNPPWRILPCISVNRMPRTAHPSNWIGGAYADYIELWYYAPQTPAGKDAIRDVMPLVRTLFTRVHAKYSGGEGIVEPANDIIPPKATAEFPQTVGAVERFRVNCSNEWG